MSIPHLIYLVHQCMHVICNPIIRFNNRVYRDEYIRDRYAIITFSIYR